MEDEEVVEEVAVEHMGGISLRGEREGRESEIVLGGRREGELVGTTLHESCCIEDTMTVVVRRRIRA